MDFFVRACPFKPEGTDDRRRPPGSCTVRVELGWRKAVPLLDKSVVSESYSRDPKIGHGSDCGPDAHTERDQTTVGYLESVMVNEDNRERLKLRRLW